MEKQVIHSNNAPAAVGPYSQAISAGAFVFTSGQLPINPETKTMPESVREQSFQSLKNVQAVLEAAGSAMGKVIKSTVYLADIADFAIFNEVYSDFFQAPFPARSCFAVKALPLGAKVEVEVVALA